MAFSSVRCCPLRIGIARLKCRADYEFERPGAADREDNVRWRRAPSHGGGSGLLYPLARSSGAGDRSWDFVAWISCWAANRSLRSTNPDQLPRKRATQANRTGSARTRTGLDRLAGAAIPKLVLSELAILAAAAIEPDVRWTAITSGLTGDASTNARHCAAAAFRNVVTALGAVRLPCPRRQSCPRSHHLVRDGIIDLILHGTVRSPPTRHRRCPKVAGYR